MKSQTFNIVSKSITETYVAAFTKVKGQPLQKCAAISLSLLAVLPMFVRLIAQAFIN